jgi:energy-coupling factor transport system permease protein
VFLEYQQGNTFLHRLDARTKLAGFLLIIIAVFLFSNPWYNLTVLLVCVLLGFSIRISVKKLKTTFLTLLPILILIILLSAISYDPSAFQNPFSKIILFSFLPGDLIVGTVGGLLMGISLSLRIFTLVISSTILTFTTPIDDFLQILKKMHVSYKIAFIITTAIRFIPTMEKKAQQIIEAQRARGAKFQDSHFINRIKAYVPVMIPMIVESLRMSENLAMAMLNRGFGATPHWTVLQEIKAGPMDIVLSIFFLILLGLLILLKTANYGSL